MERILPRRIPLLGLAMAGLLAPALGFLGTAPAHADAGDDVTSWSSVYTVRRDGMVHVDETIAYHFADVGRHGIVRSLVTREPWGSTDQDAVFRVSHVTVSSPDAPATVQSETVDNGRDQTLQLRIGDEGQVLDTQDATYHLSYDQTGLLRTVKGVPQLYVDVVSPDDAGELSVHQISVSATVPGGARAVSCFVGAPSATAASARRHCATAKVDHGVARSPSPPSTRSRR